MGGMAMTWGKRWVLSEAAVKTAVVPMTVWAPLVLWLITSIFKGRLGSPLQRMLSLIEKGFQMGSSLEGTTSDLYTGEKVPSPLARWITMNAEGGVLNNPFLVKSLARILKLRTRFDVDSSSARTNSWPREKTDDLNLGWTSWRPRDPPRAPMMEPRSVMHSPWKSWSDHLPECLSSMS